MWKTLFCVVQYSKFKNVPRRLAPPSHGFLTTLAVLLALWHGIMAVTATVEKSMTADEIAHLTAGQAYNQRGDYRLQPENGNLPQRLAALPMTLAHVALPAPTTEMWRTADVWEYGHAYFYEQGIPVDQWLFLGRGMIALVSAATGLLVFAWSRALFGWRGAFVSLTLFAFSPTFLAHGALATSDLVMTFFFLASVGAWWRHLEHPGMTWGLISAITLGLAFVAKFSAVLLPIMLALIAVVWAATNVRTAGWRYIMGRLARTTLAHGAVVFAVIWMFYGLRYTAFSPGMPAGGTFNHGWGWMFSGLGLPAKIIWWLKEWRLLPEAWLYGLTFVLQFSRARGAFMSGDYSVTGWFAFFPFAFLIKTTLPLLLIVIGGAVAAAGRAVRTARAKGLTAAAIKLRPLTPLAALFVIYWGTSLASHLNIGHRHILPTYPVLFIAAGWLGRFLTFNRTLPAVLLVTAILWHGVESLRARPHYLAYFNALVGGPANGWRHLVDSSLDWGQDLPGLRSWLDRNARNEPVFLSYFGTGDPRFEGIRATALPTLPEVGGERPWHALAPGIYAISATMLQHVYSKVRGPWTQELENEYQKLRVLESMLLEYQSRPERRAELLKSAPAENWRTAWKRYEQLRFARLCHYLRVRTPEAMIGYSILVYRVDASELDNAVGGSLRAWSAAIEKAVLEGRTRS